MDVSDRFAVINNPWADDDPSLQCLRDALSLAENMGVARQVGYSVFAFLCEIFYLVLLDNYC